MVLEMWDIEQKGETKMKINIVLMITCLLFIAAVLVEQCVKTEPYNLLWIPLIAMSLISAVFCGRSIVAVQKGEETENNNTKKA